MKIWNNTRSRRDNKAYLTVFKRNKAALSRGGQTFLTGLDIVLGYEDNTLPSFTIVCSKEQVLYNETYSIKNGRLNATTFFKWLKVRPGRYEVVCTGNGILEVVIPKEAKDFPKNP